MLAAVHLLAGELSAAERLIDEDRLIAEATGNPPVAYTAMILAAWQGREQEATEIIHATVQVATARGTGRLAGSAAYASAILDNGSSRHAAARDAARQAFECDHLGLGPQVVTELAEAAARTGDMTLVQAVLKWMNERTRVTPTAWALGIEARIRALLSQGDAADSYYKESIEHLGRTSIHAELARSYLLYGNGCAVSGVAPRRGTNCAPLTTCWTRWASRRSPSGPGGSYRPPARPPANAPSRPAAS